MKKLYTLTLSILITSILYAQSPFIGSINPTSGKAGETLTITGRGFSANASELQVRFGGAIAEIKNSTEGIIEVIIPANAGFDNIHVTNLTTNLTVSSSDQFLLSYNGESFSNSKFSAQEQLATGELSISDLCLCDFNNDGTTDVGVANLIAQTNELGQFNVYTNNSTPGNLVFAQSDIEFSETRYAVCGDINSDGLADLLVTESGTGSRRVFILENITGGDNVITFDEANIVELELPRQPDDDIRNPYEVEIKDLDNDGKGDVIVSNVLDNALYIFSNTSSGGDISFQSTPTEIFIPEFEKTGGLDIQDLNNDGFDEIIVNNDKAADIAIISNDSDQGNLNMGDIIILDYNEDVNDVEVGDLNGDGFKDIAVISRDTELGIFTNLTSSQGGQISFDAGTTLTTLNDNSWSLAMGDLNGDGKLDIVTSALQTTSSVLSTYINNSTGSTISFENAVGISLIRNVRHLEVTDIDGDSRPDLVFVHNIGAANLGDLSILLNENCIGPEISPSTTQIICNDVSLEITAPFANGTTYLWEMSLNSGGFDTIQFNGDNTIDASDYLSGGDRGQFRVTTITDAGSCSLTSDSVEVRINNIASTAPTPSYNGPVCVGDDLELTAGISEVGMTYKWTGPNGFDELSTTDPVTLPNFQLENAGTYKLVINFNGCDSEVDSVLVEARAFPFIAIDEGGQPAFCSGTDKALSIPAYDGYTYRWTQNGSDISSSNSSAITTTTDGTFTAILIDGTGCESESDPVELFRVSPPVVQVEGDQLKCVDLPIDFVANTTPDSVFTVNHTWDFDDGSPVEIGDSFTKTYTTAATYNVVLTATYNEIPECSNNANFSVQVTDIPDYQIGSDGTEKCPSDALELTLPTGFESYSWTTGDTDNTAEALTADDEESVNISVDWVDAAGCTGTSDITVTNFANSRLTVEAGSLQIVDDTVMLQPEAKSVVLRAVGASVTNPDFEWDPIQIIENPDREQVTVFPSRVYTPVMVTANTSNDCRESKSIVIENDNIVPRKTFSPNGDGRGFDCWEILNINGLPCEVYIFDSKGTVIFQASPPHDDPNNCVWDGTANGANVPEGVYYFVMKCEESQYNRSGSILLAR